MVIGAVLSLQVMMGAFLVVQFDRPLTVRVKYTGDDLKLVNGDASHLKLFL